MITKGNSTRNFRIEKAAPIFNTKGIAGTSISDIMQATKLAKGGIYRHFQSKDELCIEVFNYLCTNLSTGINNSVKGKLTAKDKLFAIIHYYRDDLSKIEGGCPLLNFGTEANDTNPMLKQGVEERIKALQNRISNLIKVGIDELQFQKHINADIFAAHMFSIIEGGMLMTKVFGNPEQMRLVTDRLITEIESFSM